MPTGIFNSEQSKKSGRMMNLLRIDQNNVDDEYEESTNAIRDFLYMFFEIAGDCLPVGDFDRAELGEVDPYKYLDIQYEYRYQFRSDAEIAFLHQGAAINLLCRLAQVNDEDQCSRSTLLADFNNEQVRAENEEMLMHAAPDLFKIYDAWSGGRIIATPSIRNSFHLAFSDSARFHASLEAVLNDVILKTFDGLRPSPRDLAV